MNDQAKQQARLYLTDYVESITDHSQKGNKKGYICPLCFSGTGKNKTGAFSINKDKVHWKCFSCGEGGDIFDLIEKHENVSKSEAFKQAGELSGVNLELETNQFQERDDYQIHIKEWEEVSDQVTDYTEFYNQAKKNLNKTDYLEKRGISLETAEKFNIGFANNWKTEEAPATAVGQPMLIIPFDDTHYITRSTTDGTKNIFKQQVKGTDTTKFPIFNEKVLNEETQVPIFVTEGVFDALSLIELGHTAIALGGTSNNRLIDILKDISLERPLILALDNDNSGIDAQKRLATKLNEIETDYVISNLCLNDIKDVNEMLLKHKEEFNERINKVISEAKTDREKYLSTSTDNYVQDFINSISESVGTEYISTGFSNLDDLLDGGFYEGLIILGAISSLGKTTLATQIADYVAQAGTDVIIFSLEMARSEIMAKSFSRGTALAVLENKKKWGSMKNAKTVRGITTYKRYEKYNNIEKELIEYSINSYSKYANHIHIVEGLGNIGVSEIRSIVEKHFKYKETKPLILVDYLQILAPHNERATDKQNTDKAVLELKRISRDFKIPVLAISSFNRANYSESVSMSAFKESGAIEYSSDILIGLQLEGTGTQDFDVDKAKSQEPRKIELKILKNRNGKTGTSTKFDYYPMFNLFKAGRE